MRSMSSDLSTKHLMRDYNQSVVIKNRLRRYQSNKDGAVVLKAEKLLGNAYLLACRQR